MLLRSRERLVHQRTELINALRATLYEYGYVVPQGAANLKRIMEIVEAETSYLPELAREEARDLIVRISEIPDSDFTNSWTAVSVNPGQVSDGWSLVC